MKFALVKKNLKIIKKTIDKRPIMCYYIKVASFIELNMEGFPSGQRGQTVNLLQLASMVRIHLPPPKRKILSFDRIFRFVLFNIHHSLNVTRFLNPFFGRAQMLSPTIFKFSAGTLLLHSAFLIFYNSPIFLTGAKARCVPVFLKLHKITLIFKFLLRSNFITGRLSAAVKGTTDKRFRAIDYTQKG